jgi:phosphatidylserine/phosphatidylglycerophosphate/cardiolipin synthase-like enzyme
MVKKIVIRFLLVIIFLSVPTALFNILKPLPEGVSVEGKEIFILKDEIEFLYDITYLDNENQRISEQEIFDRVFEMIENADHYILVDMFLIRSDEKGYRGIARELVDSLIEKKKENPEIDINLITDPYNTMFASPEVEPLFKELIDANINFVVTDYGKLRDSNPVYSAIWRVSLQWFGVPDSGWISNPLSNHPKKIGIRNVLKLLNFKANHRKVVITDSGDKVATLVTSANPHDASSAHSNVALYFETDNWKDIYLSEKSIANLSTNNFVEIDSDFFTENKIEPTEYSLQILTEGKIKSAILKSLDETVEGDQINLAMFYMSDRDVVKALISAAKRDVSIKMILDPNKDAFGIEKNGIPNRQVAYELLKKGEDNIQIRWYDTHGEQFHTKLLLINKTKKPNILMLGSANYTKRNLADYNLETNILLKTPADSKELIKANEMFTTAWENKNDRIYTVDYKKYRDDSKFKYWIYRFQEKSGMSTW